MAEFRQILALVAGLLVDLWIGGTGVLVLILIARGKIDLSRLISEPNGDASMSRFQLLIFTLVIGLSVRRYRQRKSAGLSRYSRFDPLAARHQRQFVPGK